MKAKMILSILCGLLFAIPTYLILSFIIPDEAFGYSITAGCASVVLMFPTLIILDKHTNKRYIEAEQKIKSPIFLKTNGNFDLGTKVKNGNIYFCEDGIVLISLDEKPYAYDEILLKDIERYEFDNIHMNIYAKDGRVFIVTLPNAYEVLKELKKKNWIQ